MKTKLVFVVEVDADTLSPLEASTLCVPLAAMVRQLTGQQEVVNEDVTLIIGEFNLPNYPSADDDDLEPSNII